MRLDAAVETGGLVGIAARVYTGVVWVGREVPLPVLICSLKDVPDAVPPVRDVLHFTYGLPLARTLLTAHSWPLNNRLTVAAAPGTPWRLEGDEGPLCGIGRPSPRWRVAVGAHASTLLLLIAVDREMPPPGVGSRQLYPWLAARVARSYYYAARVACTGTLGGQSGA